MRLIDADKLKIDIDCNVDFGGIDNRLMVLEQIDNAPTVEERKVGEWILSRPGIYTCSICGLDASAGEVNHQGYVYCPKCGNRVERYWRMSDIDNNVIALMVLQKENKQLKEKLKKIEQIVDEKGNIWGASVHERLKEILKEE